MSVITTLNSGDALEPTSRTNINTNFANLNTDKQEKPVGAVTNNIVLFGAANVLVDSGKAVPSGTIVGTSDSQALSNKDLTAGTNTFPTSLATLTGIQTLTNKTLTAPTIGDFTNAGHTHQNAAGGGTLAEAALVLTDITTNNATSSKHGFLPKLSGNSSDVLKGDGTFGAGGSGGFSSRVFATMSTTQATGNATVNFDTVSFDGLTEFNTTTHTFTAQAAGFYFVACSLSVTSAADQQDMEISILKNGSAVLDKITRASGTASHGFDCVGLVQLAAGDTLKANVFLSTAQTINNGSNSCWLAIHRLS